MTEKEIEVLKSLFFQARCSIGYDLQTKTGWIDRQGIWEVILDSGWAQHHAEDSRDSEDKRIWGKFMALSWEERNKLKTQILPQEEYDCGKNDEIWQN